MFQTAITIQRQLAVINGYVEVPDSQRTARTALTPSTVTSLISGSSRARYGLHRIIDQEWIALPSYDRFAATQPPEDYFATLRAAAG